jgi:hypothetical protein
MRRLSPSSGRVKMKQRSDTVSVTRWCVVINLSAGVGYRNQWIKFLSQVARGSLVDKVKREGGIINHPDRVRERT